MINSEITKIVLRKLFLLGLYVLGVAATCPASPTPSGNQSENQPSPPTETVARLVPDTPPIKNVLPKSARGIHILGGKWEIKYERHVSFELTSSSSRTYLIEALCEQENLGLAILDSERHVLEVGLGVETRLLRKSIKIDLNPDTKYTVVVGTRSLEKDLSFSIWATSNTGTHIPPDPSRPVIKVSPDRELKRSLSASSYVFENRSADFVAIDLPPDDKKWIRVRVSSPDFDPVLFSLNANDEIQTYSDDAGSDTLDAELTLSPGKYDSVLVITTVGRSILKEDTSKPYTLHVKSYPYNPAKGALGWLEYKFTNPVTTFLSGVLLSVLVGYFFFWKTLRLKRICFEVLSDRFLIDERKAPSPALKIRTNDEPLRCASYYEIVLWHAGYLRITSDHVRRQLRLRLGNVTRILHVNTQTRTGGWLEPQVPADDDATILLSFSNLDPGDKLVLGAICEQAEPAKIVTDVEGDVSETKVQAKERVLSSTTLWLIGVFNVIFFILGPIILFDLWLNFMPGWFPRLLAFVWVPFMLIYMGFFILSRRGRRLFIGYVAAIVYDHPLHLFTKRKSGKEHGTG